MAIRTNGLFLIIWFAGYHSDVVVLFFGESEHSDNTCFRSIFFYPAVMLLGRFPVLNYTHKHFGSNPQIPVFDKKLTKMHTINLSNQEVSFESFKRREIDLDLDIMLPVVVEE